jgi:hypothetical protein
MRFGSHCSRVPMFQSGHRFQEVHHSLAEVYSQASRRRDAHSSPQVTTSQASLTFPFPVASSPRPSSAYSATKDHEKAGRCQPGALLSPTFLPALHSYWFEGALSAICPGFKIAIMVFPSFSWKWKVSLSLRAPLDHGLFAASSSKINMSVLLLFSSPLVASHCL